MRNWGICVTCLYALIVLGLVVPGAARLSLPEPVGFLEVLRGLGEEPLFLIWTSLLVLGQATLLFLAVDSTAKRLRPRQSILLSGATVSMATALLTLGAGWSLLGALSGKENDSPLMWWGFESRGRALSVLLVFWLLWGVVFYLYSRGKSIAVSRLVGWLLKGSVLELLIAVPCHVYVRRRGDCSAPIVTGYGIATGIAVMLLSFGPSVLFLYQRRLQEYRHSPASPAPGDGPPLGS